MTELNEVSQRLVKIGTWPAFQDKVHIQVIGSKQVTVLQDRLATKGNLFVSQVTFNLFLVPIHHENTR